MFFIWCMNRGTVGYRSCAKRNESLITEAARADLSSFDSEKDVKRKDCRRDDSVLHHIMEKAKLWGKKTDGGLPGAGRRLTSGWGSGRGDGCCKARK